MLASAEMRERVMCFPVQWWLLAFVDGWGIGHVMFCWGQCNNTNILDSWINLQLTWYTSICRLSMICLPSQATWQMFERQDRKLWSCSGAMNVSHSQHCIMICRLSCKSFHKDIIHTNHNLGAMFLISNLTIFNQADRNTRGIHNQMSFIQLQDIIHVIIVGMG